MTNVRAHVERMGDGHILVIEVAFALYPGELETLNKGRPSELADRLASAAAHLITADFPTVLKGLKP